MLDGPSGPTKWGIFHLPKEVGLEGFKGGNLPLPGLLNMSGGGRCPAQGALGGIRVAAAGICMLAQLVVLACFRMYLSAVCMKARRKFTACRV